MSKTASRPKISVTAYYDGNATLHEVFGKVYAQIIRDKRKSAPLQFQQKTNTLKLS